MRKGKMSLCVIVSSGIYPALIGAMLTPMFYFAPQPGEERCFTRDGALVPCPPRVVPGASAVTPLGDRIVNPPAGWVCDTAGCGPADRSTQCFNAAAPAACPTETQPK